MGSMSRKLSDASKSLNPRVLANYRWFWLTVAVIAIALVIILFYQAFARSFATAIVGLVLFMAGVWLFYREQMTTSSIQSSAQSSTKQLSHSPSLTPNNDFINPELLNLELSHPELFNSELFNPELNVSGTRIMDINTDYNHLDQREKLESQYMVISHHNVKISPDISHTLDNLSDIFQQVIAQSPNPIVAINDFAEDLQTQLYKNPEFLSYFCVDGECNAEAAVNQIIKYLLTPTVYPTQKIDGNGNLIRIEYLDESECNLDKSIFIYKGYRINLHRNERNRWHFRIQKRDLSLLFLRRKPRAYRHKQRAIAAAQKLIREDIFNTWENSMDVLN